MSLVSFLLPKPSIFHPGYRPEIDGLRAVAIIPVVLFHAGVTVFSGGYVGVDVFFVISGYLITAIIHARLIDHRFSIYDFYVARIRRIFPALFAVFLATAIVGAVVLLPQDFKDFGQSLSAASVFGANVFFWLKAGYFDHAAETKPLLHTWSLGVEEQFYIFWPVVLWLVGTRLRPFVAAIFVISLVASAIAVYWAPSAAFYLIPFRAWELMAGAVISLGVLKRPKSAQLAEVLGLAGLVMVIACVFLYDRSTAFPGIAAIPPTIGAMLIILSTEDRQTLAGRLLSCRLMVGVGVISYSLYLWHWPILSLLGYWVLHPANGWEIVLLVAMIWVVSALSFHLVEQPVRRARVPSPRFVMVSGVAAVVMGVSFGVVTHIYNGFPRRLPGDVVAIANAMENTNSRRVTCDRKSPAAIAVDDVCRIGVFNKPADWTLIGDSFGDAFVPGFDKAGRLADRNGWTLTWSGCLPLWKVNQIDVACTAFMGAVTDFLRRHPEVHDIALVGRWTSGWAAERFGAFGQGGLFLTDDKSRETSVAENRAVMERAFAALFAAFPDRRFLVVVGVPEQTVFAPRDAAIRLLRGLPKNPGVPRAVFEARQAGVRDLLGRLARARPGLEVIDLATRFCTDVSCPLEQGGVFRYADDNHISAAAARSLAPELAEFLNHR